METPIKKINNIINSMEIEFKNIFNELHMLNNLSVNMQDKYIKVVEKNRF